MIWLILLVFTLIGPVYSAVMYFPFKLSKKTKKYKFYSIALYSIIITALFINMMYTMINFKYIKSELLGKFMMFFAAVYFTASIYGAVFLFIRQTIIWILYFINKRKKQSKAYCKLKSRKCINSILAFTIIMGIAGFINADIIKVKEYNININKICAKNSFDIVMITDTHMGNGDTKKEIDTVVNKSNEINPDFIFLTGDIIDENSNEENADYILKKFSSMKSKYGVFAVMGNHEGYRKGNSGALFKKYGITVLKDEVKNVDGINIIGRKDAYDNPINFKRLIAEKKVNTNMPVIVLSHEPLDYDALSLNNVDLVLSGHTHGIQFPLSYVFLRMANDMVYGHEKIRNMNAVVSSGAGEWGLHYTLPSQNEIVHIKLNMNSK